MSSTNLLIIRMLLYLSILDPYNITPFVYNLQLTTTTTTPITKILHCQILPSVPTVEDTMDDVALTLYILSKMAFNFKG